MVKIFSLVDSKQAHLLRERYRVPERKTGNLMHTNAHPLMLTSEEKGAQRTGLLEELIRDFWECSAF
jgi:hypothetical protein